MSDLKTALVTGGSGFIGTHLTSLLTQRGCKVVNFDTRAPKIQLDDVDWVMGDVLDRSQLARAFGKFMPNYVIDLAARTDCVENISVEEGYSQNILGPQNLISVANESPSVEKVVFTSTQFVLRPGADFVSDTNYSPHTIYGQSKVQMEQLIRRSAMSYAWTIIRPTNVWGPHHDRYRRQFFRVLKLGLYFHPGKTNSMKSYAYVGNVVHQISAILNLPADFVNGRTFYVGDAPCPILEWVNAFSRALNGRDVSHVPEWLMIGLAKSGDLISRISGKPFLINSSRLNSITSEYLTPMQRTFDILGEPKFSLHEGVQETVRWLESNQN